MDGALLSRKIEGRHAVIIGHTGVDTVLHEHLDDICVATLAGGDEARCTLLWSLGICVCPAIEQHLHNTGVSLMRSILERAPAVSSLRFDESSASQQMLNNVSHVVSCSLVEWREAKACFRLDVGPVRQQIINRCFCPLVPEVSRAMQELPLDLGSASLHWHVQFGHITSAIAAQALSVFDAEGGTQANVAQGRCSVPFAEARLVERAGKQALHCQVEALEGMCIEHASFRSLG